MKRFFIAALALAAVVGCSKNDEGTSILDTSKKSMAVTITNTLPEGRTVTDAAPTQNAACTKAEDLVFGFCDGSGNVLSKLTLADAQSGAVTDQGGGVYTFHGLPQQVSEVFVIANGAGANKITKDTPIATLQAAHALWEAQTVDVEWDEIIVFGHSGAKHKVDAEGKEVFCEVDGHKFPLYEASLKVTPNHARLEVGQISCMDLGNSFSKLTLNKMAVAEVLDHSFGANGEVLTPAANVLKAGEGKVWSWNLSAAPEAITRPDLDLYVTVEGNGWKVPSGTEVRRVTVIDYKAPPQYQNQATNVNEAGNLKHFLPGEIYTMNLDFEEKNITTDMGYLCVTVNVTIANWVVVPVTPVFK